MEDTSTLTAPVAALNAKTYSRRSLLKGSVTLTAAAIAAPALTIGAVESATVVERAVVAVEQWYEEVGGI